MRKKFQDLGPDMFFLAEGHDPEIGAWLGLAGYEVKRSQTYRHDLSKDSPLPKVIFQYTLSGEGSLTLNGLTTRIPAGHAFLAFSPSGARYRVSPGSASWEFAWLQLRGPEALRLGRIVQKRFGQVFKLSDTSLALRLLWEICRRAKDGDLENPFEKSELAYRFFPALFADLFGSTSSPALPSWLTKIRSHLDRHFGEKIDLDQMAGQSGYSRFHFSKIFKRLTSQSPIQYLLRVRLEKACELLENPLLSVQEISGRCGFVSLNHFTKTFVKAHGMPPRSFRKKDAGRPRKK